MGSMVNRWVADDGTEFSSKKDMLMHEMQILDEKEIDFFLTKIIDAPSRRFKEYQKLLFAWQRHIRSSTLDVEEPKQLELDLTTLNPL